MLLIKYYIINQINLIFIINYNKFACVKHITSVHSEPGSNSKFNKDYIIIIILLLHSIYKKKYREKNKL